MATKTLLSIKAQAQKVKFSIEDMSDRNHNESERDAEDTDGRLYTDPQLKMSLCELDDLSPKRDHCDLLLDAIDAQLGQLQVQSSIHQMVSKETDCSAAACLRWSYPVSKDTGLGSTRSNDTTMSCLDLKPPTVMHLSEKSCDSLFVKRGTKNRLNRQAKGKEDMESRREQVIWRLEKLLGDACSEDGLAREMPPPSDSICTEDFHRCFREEMVGPALSETNVHQLDIEEAEGAEVTDSDNDQSEQKRHVFNFERGGLALMGKSNKITSAHYYESDMPQQRKEPEKYLSYHYGLKISHGGEKAGASERYKLAQRSDDNAGRWNTLIQCVTSLDDHSTNYCNSDASKQEESEPLAHRCTNGNIKDGRSSVHKVQHNKKETSRLRWSSGDNDKETDEENNLWNRGHETEWELERLAADTAQMEKEKRTLECVLIDSRDERDSISCQLKLPKQRESFVFDFKDTEKEVETIRQRKQTLTAGSCKERNVVIMSVLEKEEMERQLDNTKTELFAEQRRAREELESMQEKLEETCELLQRATEAEASLRETCACLEAKQKQKKEQLEAAETRVTELHVELGEYNIRLGSLEKLLAQKELQLMEFQEQCEALQADRDKLKVELQQLKTSYYKTLEEAQEQAYRTTQVEEGKVNALKEETKCLTQHIESLQRSVQLKEEEAGQLRESLEMQRVEAKNLDVEALEKHAPIQVHKAIDEERRKWEAEKVEAVRVHCRILEEQNGRSLEKMRSEMQREKSKALAFQEQVLKLKTTVQELESERCAQHREQESLLAGICKSLKEEHQAQLHRLQKEMAEESQRKVLRIQQASQLAEEEAGRLRVMLEEKESSQNQITAELDQQLRAWTTELGTECQHLHLLVEQCGAKQRALHLPLSPTAAEALANLRTLREHLKHLISHLQQELESQKQTSQQLQKDKERELSIQRQQLRVERDQALGFLKEQLILEHVEELSRLSLVRMGGGRADGGVAESLHKQLKAKDLELRQVQKNTGRWREQTAARLASRFELQRKAEDVQREGQKMRDGTEGKMAFNAKEAQICSSSLCAVDSAASYCPSDSSSFKLLRYLQSKVKQLRVENQAYSNSSAPSNSDLTRIQGGDSAGIWSQSSINAPSS
ncbi:myosin-8 isoform X2 [Betta splendens]|uniref:Myosin-8 isoform X2 n=1 Tax=Betta splendens TaxID=158456 RepID=A0A8M1HIC9_BETSP|nr:myosin-8 isoform X2 [Betta splendens]